MYLNVEVDESAERELIKPEHWNGVSVYLLCKFTNVDREDLRILIIMLLIFLSGCSE